MTNTALPMTDESSATAEAVALLPERWEERLLGLANRVQRCVSSTAENLGPCASKPSAAMAAGIPSSHTPLLTTLPKTDVRPSRGRLRLRLARIHRNM